MTAAVARARFKVYMCRLGAPPYSRRRHIVATPSAPNSRIASAS
jgi:hypothetical protein